MAEPIAAQRLEEISENIHLASQADLAAKKEDENFLEFIDTLKQLHLKNRLIREGEVRQKQNSRLARDTYSQDLPDIIEKTLETTLINEETAQIRDFSQKAIDVCQFSLGLQSVTVPDRDRIKSEEELYKTSIELMETSTANLKMLQQHDNVKKELQMVHNDIRRVQEEILKLKRNPSTTKDKSDSMKKYVSTIRLCKKCQLSLKFDSFLVFQT